MLNGTQNPTESLATIEQMPVLAFDFDLLKSTLESELAEFDVVVTAQTLKGAKQLATSLNKRAGEIDRIRKDRVAEISAPIKEADGKLKELVAMCKSGRQKILDQVSVFEDETRGLARTLLDELRLDLWANAGIKDEFRRAEFDDLVKLTSVTDNGNLTKSARDTLGVRVLEDKALQDRTERRLLELENRCLKAGMLVALERHSVEHFLFSDDDVYERLLGTHIDAEIERQRKADEIRAQREAQVLSESQAPAESPQTKEAPARSTSTVDDAPKPPEGRVAWVVCAEFHVSTAPNISTVNVEAKLRDLLTNAGAGDSLVRVDARRA